MGLSFRIPLSPFLPKAADGGNRVLLVRDDVIGDLIVPASAVVQSLSRHGYDVYLVLREELMCVGALFLPEDRLIGVDIKRYRNDVKYRYNFLKQLRLIGFSIAMGSTIPSSVNSDILRGSGAEQKWGYKRDSSFKEFRRMRGISTVKTRGLFEEGIYLSVLEHERHFLSSVLGRDAGDMRPYVNAAAEDALIHGEYIHYMPEAGNLRRAYPKDEVLDILTGIAEKMDITLVITGVNRLDYSHERCKNLTGETTLEEVINIVANAGYVVGNESGLTHMAWILNKPTVLFYGGGHFGRFRPQNGALVITKHMDCFCCDWKCFSGEDIYPCVKADNIKHKLESYIEGSKDRQAELQLRR